MAPEILSGKNCHDIAAIWVAFFSNTSMSAISLRTGERYNEKVDVYSFALVLLELVACEMPWFSVKTSAPAPGLFPPCSALLTTTRLRRDGVPISPTEVPHRVISHERPESQLGARLPLCPAKGRVHASHLGMRFAEAADEDLAQLVRECWHKLPKRRPTFQEVRAHCTRKPGCLGPPKLASGPVF